MKRLIIIDYVKVIGIWLVILGHFFPGLIKSFIFSFHVPLFFIISGFLDNKKDKSQQQKKSISNIINKLILPYLLINVINLVIHLLHTNIEDLSAVFFLKWVCNIICGIHGMNQGESLIGCGETWFIYTLIIIKLFSIMINIKKHWYILFFLSIICAYFQRILGVTQPFAINTLSLSFIFYIEKDHILKVIDRFNAISINRQIITIIGIVIFQYLAAYYNGVATIIVSDYGRFLFLFFLLGVTGTLMVLLCSQFIISRITHDSLNKVIMTLSIGTIIILGFHMHFVKLFNTFMVTYSLDRDIYCYPFSMIILILFIPIIKIIRTYIPVLIGR